MKNTSKYQWRYEIITLLDTGMMTALDAAWELNLSIRHTYRLLETFRENKKDLDALMPQARSSAWNKKNKDIVNTVVDLKKERHARSNQHIAECVQNKHLQNISATTVRNILIRNNCYEQVKRERRVFQKLEEKITKSGQMVQFDGCEGAWLAGYRRVYLIAFMDAYSRYIVGWSWVNSYSAWNNILVLRSVVRKYGVPDMFYTDNASFYKVIRHNNSIHQIHKPEDQYETAMQRMILDVGSVMVNHKPYQPQGKGRIERFFRFMQDRFIAEHTAKTLDELNQQFKVWIKWYNTKHVIRTTGSVPKDRFNQHGFKPVTEDIVPEKVFSYHYTRKVDKYNGFSFEGTEYIIDPKNCRHFNGCLTGCTVELYVTPTTIVVYHQELRIQQFKQKSKQ